MYPSFMNASYLDYVIGDSIVAPLRDDKSGGTKVLRMPGSYFAAAHAYKYKEVL